MAEAELAAIVDALPERPYHAATWVDEQLRASWPEYAPKPAAGADDARDPDSPTRVRAWSVGCVLGNETLVQNRPVVRDENVGLIEDFLRTLAPCTVAMFATTRESSRPGTAAICRFQRWIGACSQSSLLDTPAASKAELRTKLREALPDFLERSRLQKSDDELLFFSFLRHLHAASALSPAFAGAQVIRQALDALGTELEGACGADFACNLMVHDGRTFAMLHRGGRLTHTPAPAREISHRRTGPSAMDGIPRGSGLWVLARDGEGDTGENVVPNGVFSVDPADPLTIQR